MRAHGGCDRRLEARTRAQARLSGGAGPGRASERGAMRLAPPRSRGSAGAGPHAPAPRFSSAVQPASAAVDAGRTATLRAALEPENHAGAVPRLYPRSLAFAAQNPPWLSLGGLSRPPG